MPSDYTLGNKLSYTAANAIKNHNAGVSAPTNKGTGECWWDSTNHRLYLWDGSAWVAVPPVPVNTIITIPGSVVPAGTGYASHDDHIIYTDFLPYAVTCYFEANINAGNASYTMYLQLYNTTDAAAVASSEISSAGTTAYTRVRSSAITLPVGKTITVQSKYVTGAGAANGCKLVFK